MYSNKEIENARKRFDYLIKVLKEIIEAIEPNYIGNQHWYSMGVNVAKKFLIQSTTLQALYRMHISYDGDLNKSRIIDFSSMNIILRSLYETYALYYHLFIPCDNIEENIVRFRLWELDGYRTKRSLYQLHDIDDKISRKIQEENIYIKSIKETISGLSFFNNLDTKKQNYLIEKTAWRFTNKSLQQKDINKWNSSIQTLIRNTNIHTAIIDNMYSRSSSHAHSGFMSIIDIIQDTVEEKIEHEYMNILSISSLICLMVVALKSRYSGGEEYYDNLSSNTKETIDSFVRFAEHFSDN